MNPFDAYAKKANTIVNQPTPLLGPIKTRAEARVRCAAIGLEIARCATSEQLESYLASVAPELVQFRTELEFLWFGEGDFLGLEKEIEWARARVDDRLDYPRWEDRYLEEGTMK